MDYTECLKIHGYIADTTDRENSKVEEIYNKYKPPPVPYDEFRHRVVTIYANSSTTLQSNDSSSSGSNTATHTANPSATVQRNRFTPPVSNVNSMIQQQLDQFVNSYQQRTDTPIRDILSQPNTVRRPARARERVRVQNPPPAAARAPVVPLQPASRVYTLTPPPAANIPAHNIWTERRSAVHNEPTRPPSPSTDIQVPYQPLVSPESTTHQPARRPRRRRQQQQQQEEEMNNCCCCIC